MGERVALQVASASSGITAQIGLARDSSILEIVAPAALAGRTLAEADVRRRFNVTVVAVKRRREGEEVSEDVIVSPSTDLRIGPNDLILVAGKNDDLLRLQQVTE